LQRCIVFDGNSNLRSGHRVRQQAPYKRNFAGLYGMFLQLMLGGGEAVAIHLGRVTEEVRLVSSKPAHALLVRNTGKPHLKDYSRLTRLCHVLMKAFSITLHVDVVFLVDAAPQKGSVLPAVHFHPFLSHSLLFRSPENARVASTVPVVSSDTCQL
jgi:hypothetical protein